MNPNRFLQAVPLAGLLVLAGGPAGATSYGFDRDFEFAVIDDPSHTTLQIGNSDHWDGLGRLQREVKSSGRPLFWFSRDGQEYVVRDEAIVSRARAIVEPMSAIGEKQGRIGAKQGEIGGRQGAIGALQGRAGLIQARLALSGEPSGRRERAERDALREELRDLSRQIDDLEREQKSLGERQRILGKQQGELGRQQARASKIAQSQLRDLAEDAIASGAARRLKD